MNEYFLGEMVGAAIPPALVAFWLARKQTKGVAPYLVAAGAALAGVGGMLGFNLLTHRLGTSDADVRNMAENFSKGCVRSCVTAGASDAQCRALCACVLTNLRARYPSNERFARWLRESDSQSESIKKEAVELGTSCLPAARAAGSTN